MARRLVLLLACVALGLLAIHAFMEPNAWTQLVPPGPEVAGGSGARCYALTDGGTLCVETKERHLYAEPRGLDAGGL